MASITLSTAPLGYTENGEKIALDSAAFFDAAGLSGNNLDGFELSVSLETGGLPSDRLSVGVNTAEGVGLDGRIIRLNNIEIATFSGGVGTEPLVIRFNANAQPAAAQSVLRALDYVNLSDALPETGDRLLSLQLRSAQQVVEASASRSLTAAGVDDAAQVYQTLTLYDGSTNLSPDASGSAPNGPWLDFLNLAAVTQGSVANQPGNGGTVLTTDNAASGGFSNYEVGINLFQREITVDKVQSSFPTLDRSEGYVLSFTADLLSTEREATADKNNDGKDDRAGFNLTLLSEDLRGIGLNFFEDRIWAYDDGTTQLDPSLEPDVDPPSDFRTLFTQAEGVDFNTTELTQYDVAVKGDLYTVFANGNLILSGRLRDYSDFPTRSVPVPLVGSIDLPDFNELPSSVFLGDLTPSAGASTKITEISISTPAALPTISVVNGSVINLPQFFLNDADGNDQATTVLLSVTSGSLSLTGNNDVTVTASNLGLVLDGRLAAINALLNDSQNFGYQPAAGATEDVPIAIEFEPDLSGQKISAVASDINGDGFSDIVLRNSFSGDNQVQFMNGTAAISNSNLGPSIQDENWQIVGTGDFNNDSQTDILWRHRTTGQVLVWYMENGQPQRAELVGRPITESALEIVGTGDFNNDGRTDIVLRNYNTNQNLIWYMNGSQIIQEGGVNLNTLDPLDTAWRIQATADFNDDGQTDILLRNMDPSDQGQNIVWFMNGSEVIGESPIGRDEPDLNWEIAGSADFNDNGQSDILLRNYATGVNLIWLMNGTNIVQETPLLAMLNN